MFGRMMNNYYYGKSGKGDFRREDLPETRMQLFRDTLKTRLSGLCRLNLLYVLLWLPAMLWIYIYSSMFFDTLNIITLHREYSYSEYVEMAEANQIQAEDEDTFIDISAQVALVSRDFDRIKAVYGEISPEEFAQYASGAPTMLEYIERAVSERIVIFGKKINFMLALIILFVCIAITGPFTAGVSYVTRNWARDEHAFIWSDFKDAVKANWKIPLALSTITGLIPAAVYAGWTQYGELSQTMSMVMVIPQILVVLLSVIWAISITYMHPITVTYDLKLTGVIRNGLILGIARLPFSVGIRLLHCVPLLIGFAAVWFFGVNLMVGLVSLGGYYILIGFALSRFITASYTNAVFDRFINSRMEGVQVNRGMRESEDDEDEYGESEPEDEESGKV